MLRIAPGDTVTATYIDADDGAGGIDVPVTATAVVDCLPPVIANVQVGPIKPQDATITLATDEPAQVTIRYGTSCGALTGSQSAPGFRTAHSIKLANLAQLTTYHFVVDAADEAGNGMTDDNGGACYTFATPKIPNYFTEWFTNNDNDLPNRTLQFAPDPNSGDFYVGCTYAITALPTDPSGGTTLTFSPNGDDGHATVTLSGVSVALYGVNYTQSSLTMPIRPKPNSIPSARGRARC